MSRIRDIIATYNSKPDDYQRESYIARYHDDDQVKEAIIKQFLTNPVSELPTIVNAWIDEHVLERAKQALLEDDTDILDVASKLYLEVAASSENLKKHYVGRFFVMIVNDAQPVKQKRKLLIPYEFIDRFQFAYMRELADAAGPRQDGERLNDFYARHFPFSVEIDYHENVSTQGLRLIFAYAKRMSKQANLPRPEDYKKRSSTPTAAEIEFFGAGVVDVTTKNGEKTGALYDLWRTTQFLANNDYHKSTMMMAMLRFLQHTLTITPTNGLAAKFGLRVDYLVPTEANKKIVAEAKHDPRYVRDHRFGNATDEAVNRDNAEYLKYHPEAAEVGESSKKRKSGDNRGMVVI